MRFSRLKTFYTLVANKTLTFSRFINIAKVELSAKFGKTKLMGYPYTLIIEPTNICNLKCPTCPTGCGKLTRPKGMMPFKTFKKVIDELSPHILYVILMNYGEPLLNKDFYEMVKYASSKHLRTFTCTNGQFINAKKIVDSGLDEIAISLDAVDQKTLAKFRKNSDIIKVINGIKALVAEKARQNSKKPTINLQFILMKHNERQLDEFKKLANSLGVDSISIKALWATDVSNLKKFMPSNKEFQRYIIKGNDFESKAKALPCRKPWSEIVVNWDGSVAFCCADYNNDIELGNVNNKSLKEILNSPKFINVRKTVLKDRLSLPPCRKCAAMADISITEKLSP